MEVAVGLHAPVGQHHGVVDGGGQLAGGHQGGVRHGVAAGAGDLRGAAHGVGVLHARGGLLLVVADEPGALQDGGHVRGGGTLPRVRTDGVQLGLEHLLRTEQRLQGEGGGDVGGGVELAEVGEGHDQHAEHAVGAVEEGEALLLAEHDGLDAGFGEQFAGGADGAVRALGVALAHEGERAVGQRREVAGAAQGAVLVDDGGDPGVEHVGHGLRDGGAYAGVAGGDGLEAEEHQRADDLPLDARAHAGGVRADDVALELGTQLGADVPGGERTEPGGHPVDGLGLGGEGVDDLAGPGECVERLRGELDACVATGYGDDVLGGGPGRPHHDSVHIHIQHPTD